jgi:hypothetical protein
MAYLMWLPLCLGTANMSLFLACKDSAQLAAIYHSCIDAGMAVVMPLEKQFWYALSTALTCTGIQCIVGVMCTLWWKIRMEFAGLCLCKLLQGMQTLPERLTCLAICHLPSEWCTWCGCMFRSIQYHSEKANGGGYKDHSRRRWCSLVQQPYFSAAQLDQAGVRRWIAVNQTMWLP